MSQFCPFHHNDECKCVLILATDPFLSLVLCEVLFLRELLFT